MSRNKHLYHEIQVSNDDYEDDNFEWESNKDILFTSVKLMKVAELRRLLDHGVKPNFRNKYQQTALHVAVLLQPSEVRLEIIRLLIAFGCPVDAQDRFGLTALHEACFHLELNCIPILLEAGCYVNMQDNSGRTPLMVTCGLSSTQMLFVVQYLLDWGASVNTRDTSGKNALYYLIIQSMMSDMTVRSEIIYKLLYAGIDVNYRYYKDEPLAQCLFNESSRVLSLYDGLQCDYRPLLCGGCQILENKNCYSTLSQKLVLLNGSHLLDDTLGYLVDIFTPICSLKTLRNLRNYLRNVDFLKDRPAVRKLEGLVNNVKSLKCISRIAIRRRLNNSLFFKVEKLNLPKELVEFIKYSECKPHFIGS